VIQLTQTSYVVLGLVSHMGEATPYDLKQIVAATIGGFFDVPHSQLYAEPERLAKAGYLSERREDGGRRRKHYALTQSGRQALEEWLRTPTEDLYELRDPGLLKLAFGSDPTELARTQLKAHEEQLHHLQQMARTLEMAGATEGQRLVAEAGVGHEKEYIRFWKRILKNRPNRP
jgi:PadR family transcriptional regulator, regulatory protein AphA